MGTGEAARLLSKVRGHWQASTKGTTWLRSRQSVNGRRGGQHKGQSSFLSQTFAAPYQCSLICFSLGGLSKARQQNPATGKLTPSFDAASPSCHLPSLLSRVTLDFCFDQQARNPIGHIYGYRVPMSNRDSWLISKSAAASNPVIGQAAEQSPITTEGLDPMCLRNPCPRCVMPAGDKPTDPKWHHPVSRTSICLPPRGRRSGARIELLTEVFSYPIWRSRSPSHRLRSRPPGTHEILS